MTDDQMSAAKARLEAVVTHTTWYASYNEWFEPEDDRVGNWFVSTEEDAPFEGRGVESFVADFVHEQDARFIAAVVG